MKGDEPTLRQRATDLYEPPFRFECGYIFDAKGQMVADQGGAEGYALRVRGWGRIGYMESPEQLQDEVGEKIAEILTQHWSDDSGVQSRSTQRGED